jgi:AcrR family transcriptional regulator
MQPARRRSAALPTANTAALRRARRRMAPARRAEQLLDVAERLFSEQDYGSTSIEQIAGAAGVTRPVVYDRFGSKDGLYLACLRRARAQLEEAMFTAMAAIEPGPEQLRRGADAYFGFVERNPQRWRVLFGGGMAVPGALTEEAVQLRFGTETRLAEMLRGVAPGAGESRRRGLAHAIGGAAHQLAQWWLRTPELTRATLVDHYCAFAWPAIQALISAS